MSCRRRARRIADGLEHFEGPTGPAAVAASNACAQCSTNANATTLNVAANLLPGSWIFTEFTLTVAKVNNQSQLFYTKDTRQFNRSD
jgi:hypothetical protein